MVRLMKSEKGFSLIEVIIAIAILGIIGTAFLGALATASKAMFVADERATAESLARSQMEYVKSQVYDAASYSAPIPQDYLDADYWATIDVELLPDPDGGTLDDIQKIIVKVYHPYDALHPEKTKLVVTLEGYKVDR